ncbi:MAG: delta-60 repeat domain-containing protein [Phycisphaerales bacterium]|nr:delta-60 repeat domain-containing protein [Phycisphaerales bacterium]
MTARSLEDARRLCVLALAGMTLGLAADLSLADCTGNWVPGTAESNMNGSIRWLHVWDPDGAGPQEPVLVATGDFSGTASAGVADANYIASWDGANWSALGTGLSAPGYCVTSLSASNTLVVCGTSFSQAGGNPAKRIARWNGVAWSDLATGTGNSPSLTLLAAASPNSDTVVTAGAFTQVGATPVAASRIAQWSEANGWSPLGAGLSSTTSAVFVMPNGDLIAGGAALTTGDGALTVNRIARWDGSTWHALGDGVSGLVRCMAAMPNGDLIVGGAFLEAGGVTVNKLARWNGTAWSGFGTGINTATSGNFDVFALAVMPNGDLIVAGDFSSVDGVPANRIARLSNGQWSALGTGVDAVVRALAVLPNGDLAVGGDFQNAGGNPAARFAIWSGSGSNVAITTEPTSQEVEVTASAQFTLAATGGGSITYQWQQQDLLSFPEFIDINDGPVLDSFGIPFCTASGATANQLTLSDFTGVAQVFRCVVSNGCSSAISLEVTLSFAPECPADFNGSGEVSVQDIFDFLEAYFGSNPDADVNDSGDITVQDIFDYLALYFTGCGE